MAFRQIVGRKVVELDTGAILTRAGGMPVLVDIGAGDGTFVLDYARANPDWLVIGLDAAAENLARASRVASTKKTRLDNVCFLRGAAEKLPDVLAGIADRITIYYPWGSLLRIVSEPVIADLTSIRACCKPGAPVSILLNYSVFEDSDYLARLDLSDAGDPAAREDLADAYARAGLRITERRLFDGDPDVRTAWGRQLVRGAARRTLAIEADAIDLWHDAETGQ